MYCTIVYCMYSVHILKVEDIIFQKDSLPYESGQDHLGLRDPRPARSQEGAGGPRRPLGPAKAAEPTSRALCWPVVVHITERCRCG